MTSFFRKLPDPLVRILLVFLLLVAAFLVLRFTLPRSMTDMSLHVQSTIEREMSRPLRFAGSAQCADCHEESNLKETGYHRMLSCETCHGPARNHAEDPTTGKPVEPRKREFCTLCHQFDASRPTGFPQINPVAHNPLRPCISCHNPHDPKPPSAPEECQACHAEIARTKAVSPHVLLSCATCHTAPDLHRVAPRMNPASKPTERAFCGKCHAKQSTVSGTPKIDLAAHGEKYLCWQCHYPHMPEVK